MTDVFIYSREAEATFLQQAAEDKRINEENRMYLEDQLEKVWEKWEIWIKARDQSKILEGTLMPQ